MHTMLRMYRSVPFALLALWLAGCQTSSRQRVATTTLLPTVTVPEPIAIAPPAPIAEALPPAQAVVAPPANVPSANVAQSWPSNWNNVWIPLETWGRYNGVARLRQHGSNLTPAYELRTSNAVMSLKVGSKVARCNGCECWLAYTPQIIKGLPYIHSLDAQKNLQPLVVPALFQFKTERTIVIDPGHGGKDSGAKDIQGNHFEKEYTLDCALRLRRILAANGWRVILTRTNDVSLSLPDRIAVAERYQADLFVSLHFNSGVPNRELAGIETYCLTPTGMPSSLVRAYADDV